MIRRDPFHGVDFWWELSTVELCGLLLVNLTWYQYFNRCRSNIHLILTDEHKNLPIVRDPSVLKLVARTGKSIPTPPAKQLALNVRRSLNIFCIRVYRCLSKAVHLKLIQQGVETSRAAGLPDWRPCIFHHSDAMLKKERDFVFSEACTTWRENRGRFPGLRSTLARFEVATIEKANSICSSLPGCKWSNLSFSERCALLELRSNPDIRLCQTDKGMGPALVSESIYVEQLALTLRDTAGTYQELVGVTQDQVMKSMHKDFQAVAKPFRKLEGFKTLFRQFDKYHNACLKEPRLCPIYLLPKVHKSGMETRPIVNNVNYYTCQVSTFLHCILKPKVFANEHILTDSVSLIRLLDGVRVPAGHKLRIATFDVTALYPSIHLESGLRSLAWFLETFCPEFSPVVKELVIVLARFVLRHCYISCPEVSEHPFLQLIGTAMGTSFAVMYANIHVMFIEFEIVLSFSECVILYRRLVDDGKVLWLGSDEDFAVFSRAFSSIDPMIIFIWTALSNKAVYLDLRIEISDDNRIHYEVYSKPGNAYAYLPHGSFHVRTSFATWIRGLLFTALTHSSDIDRWSKRCRLLFTKLRDRGYDANFLLAEFSKVSWGDRARALTPKAKDSTHFDKRCVWSCENALGLRELFRSCKLDLSLINSTVFPARISTVIKGAKRLSAYLKK